MEASRCAYLMALGAANKLDELWIAPRFSPMIFFLYASQYLPNLFN